MLTRPNDTQVPLSPTGGSGAAFIGQNVNGIWTLEVTDGKKKRTGTLNSWSMVVEAVASAAPSQQFAIAAEPNSRTPALKEITHARPFRTAHTASWVRSVSPSLRRMCWTCSLTVSQLISNSLLICMLVIPWLIC